MKLNGINKNTVVSSGYVLKNSDGLYFIGFNQAENQLRKAKIYDNPKMADRSAADINTNTQRIPYVKHDFKRVKIEIRELPE